MSDVTPLNPQHPETHQKQPQHDNYNFQLWELIFAMCNM